MYVCMYVCMCVYSKSHSLFACDRVMNEINIESKLSLSSNNNHIPSYNMLTYTYIHTYWHIKVEFHLRLRTWSNFAQPDGQASVKSIFIYLSNNNKQIHYPTTHYRAHILTYIIYIYASIIAALRSVALFVVTDFAILSILFASPDCWNVQFVNM